PAQIGHDRRPQQQDTQQANDGGADGKIGLDGNEDAANAPKGGDPPSDTQARGQGIGQINAADRRDDQIGENEQDPTDVHKARHHQPEECVEQKVPPPYGQSFLMRLLQFVGNGQKFFPKEEVDDANQRKQPECLQHFRPGHNQQFANQRALQLLLAA